MSRRARTAERKARQAARRATLEAASNGHHADTVAGTVPVSVSATGTVQAPAWLDIPSLWIYPDLDRVGEWLRHRLGLPGREMHYADPADVRPAPAYRQAVLTPAPLPVCPRCGRGRSSPAARRPGAAPARNTSPALGWTLRRSARTGSTGERG